jgi:hypothetical protein
VRTAELPFAVGGDAHKHGQGGWQNSFASQTAQREISPEENSEELLKDERQKVKGLAAQRYPYQFKQGYEIK